MTVVDNPFTVADALDEYTGTSVSEPVITVESVTPELAEQWLRGNTRNRNVRPAHVEKLARSMSAGKWNLDGGAIRFGEEDVLLDGQHRLLAVVKSGVTIRTVVVRSLLNATQSTMDVGPQRTFGDHLKIAGEKHYTLLAATIIRLWLYENDALLSARTTVVLPDFNDLHAYVQEHPKLRGCVRWGSNYGKDIPLARSFLALARYLFDAIDEADADNFFEKLITGAELGERSPILRLRNALHQNAASRSKYRPVYLFALMIKAWNAYREGQEIQQLSWRAGGVAPEPFPQPR